MGLVFTDAMDKAGFSSRSIDAHCLFDPASRRTFHHGDYSTLQELGVPDGTDFYILTPV